MEKIGYIRVSTEHQNTDRQETQMAELGINGGNLFIEKLSGKNTNRPAFQRMLGYVRDGDEVVVSSLDRLGRNYDDIKKTVSDLQNKHVSISILDAEFLKLNTGNKVLDAAMFDMFISLLSYIAANERTKMLERQEAGIAEAKKKGMYKGKKQEYRADAPDKQKRAIYNNIVDDLNAGEAVMTTSKKYDVNRSTVYRIKKELGLI